MANSIDLHFDDRATRIWQVIDPSTDTVKERIALKDQTRGGYKAYFSPDGKKLLTMNMTSRLINVFDVANLHAEQKTLPTGKDPMGLGFSADGKRVVTASFDKTARIWDARTGEPIGKPMLEHLLDTGLIDRRNAVAQLFHLFEVLVDTNDVVAQTS